MDIFEVKYTERGTIHAIICGVEYDIPDEVYEQELRDTETDELTGETAVVAGSELRKFIMEWEALGNAIAPYVRPEPPVPQFISDRQFAQQLAKMGLITKAEALEWVKAGIVPAAFDAFVQSLPEDQQFDAEMLLSGATRFDRYHQFTETFGAARGMTPEQIDQLWREAATL